MKKYGVLLVVLTLTFSLIGIADAQSKKKAKKQEQKPSVVANEIMEALQGGKKLRVATIDDGRFATKSDGGLRVMAGTSVGQATAVQDSSDG